MKTLNLYKERKPYTVILEVKGGKKEFKIPTELTVEESERLLEREIFVSKEMKEEVYDEKDGREKVEKILDSILEYILVLIQHYQPEIEKKDLRKILSQAEIIRIFEFFKKQRFIHLLGLDASDNDGGKKKTETPEKQLEVLRQSITFLVMNGFSLIEVRKLYLDEFLQYTNSVVYYKEKTGEYKEGTYEKLKGRGDNEVVSLKKQLFNIK